MNITEILNSLKYSFIEQWNTLDGLSKCLAVFSFLVLMIGGFITGFFIISTSLVFAAAIYLQCLWRSKVLRN
jgi:hypothetical protein